MNWHKISLEGIPSWPTDESQRVLVLTRDHDFAGAKIHDIPVMDFYASDEQGETVGTEVTQVATDWICMHEVLATSQGMQWPVARDVGRIGDMSPDAHIRVGLDADNDVYVSITNGTDSADLEFCTPFTGGGRSSRTRLALIELMCAIEADNAELPSLDWWAQREALQKPPGAKTHEGQNADV